MIVCAKQVRVYAEGTYPVTSTCFGSPNSKYAPTLWKPALRSHNKQRRQCCEGPRGLMLMARRVRSGVERIKVTALPPFVKRYTAINLFFYINSRLAV